MKSDYEILKDKYGERFAKLCRTHFSIILEHNGLLPEIIQSKFAPSKSLYDDIVYEEAIDDFKNLIYSLYYNTERKKQDINETPEQLMKKAGYTLIKCETDEDVKSFMKYYKLEEQLCTFRDKNRINSHTIFFAVKDGAENLNRADFTTPRRQDQYGTSVISIQFTKGPSSTISIKNRYNHTVENPDATFSNDLENIYPGLTDSFIKYYNIDLINGYGNEFELIDYTMANDGKLCKYYHEIDNVYVCQNNIVIANGVPKKYDKCRYEIIDYFLLDKQEKKLTLLPELHHINDSFVDAFTKIKKITIEKYGHGNRLIKIYNNDNSWCEIEVDENNQIVRYKNDYITEISNDFMRNSYKITDIELPNVKSVGNYFMTRNFRLKNINCPNVEEIGDYFLISNAKMDKINFPNLKKVGKSFMYSVETDALHLPNLEVISDAFLFCSSSLKNVNLPNVKHIGKGFMHDSVLLENLYAPKLQSIGDYALYSNRNLKELYLPNLKTIGNNFCEYNEMMEVFNAPNLISIGDCFMQLCLKLKTFKAENLNQIGDNFLATTNALDTLYAPNLEKVGDYFLRDCKTIKNMDIHNITQKGEWFMSNSKCSDKIYLGEYNKDKKIKTLSSFIQNGKYKNIEK